MVHRKNLPRLWFVGKTSSVSFSFRGNKLTTKLISVWCKFPISSVLPSMQYQNHFMRHSFSSHYVWVDVSSSEEEKIDAMWIISKCSCFLPSEKYPDSKWFEQVFMVYVNQTHKSHKCFVPFSIFLSCSNICERKKSHKWHQISIPLKISLDSGLSVEKSVDL